MFSAPQLEEVNLETSRSRDLEKLINRGLKLKFARAPEK